MSSPTLAIYGFFGIQNIGNECTLQATCENARELLGAVTIRCIALDPERVTADHGLDAVAISQTAPGADPPADEWRLRRWARLALDRAPRELTSLPRILRRIGRSTTLVIAGTGILEDDSTAVTHMLDLLKWAVACRLRGGRVVFLSVGAGEMRPAASRWMCRRIMAMADYVSYRDERSRSSLAAIGVDVHRHHVCPDLAFSLAAASRPSAKPSGDGLRTVGIGVVDQSKFVDASGYRDYLQTLAAFVAWLVRQDIAVHLLHGDGKYDIKTLDELLQTLHSHGIDASDGRVRVPPIRHAQDLLALIAELDVVIASRYHNVILSLAMGKPVIALSYHPKFASLMQELAMEHLCIELPEVSQNRLVDSFGVLQRDARPLAAAITRRIDRYRPLLAQQYAAAFSKAV